MGLETRIRRRAGSASYYLICHVPAELRPLVPGGKSGQKWFSLGTADPAEAKRIGRVRSVEFDHQLDAARRQLRGEESAISHADAARLAALLSHRILSEDEEDRRRGLPYAVVEEDATNLEALDAHLRKALATGNADGGEFGLSAFLAEQGVHVSPGSEAYRLISYELLKALRKTTHALQARNAGDVVETPPRPSAATASRSCTVEELITGYLDDPTKKRTPGTLKTYQTVFRAMRELLGGETPVDSIHRMDCERVRSVIMRLPKNASQRFPSLTLEEAANEADARGLERIGVAAVNNYLSNLSALFNWGVENWRVTRNPAKGLMLPDDRDERDARQPFMVEQLQAIFNAPLYRGCQDDEEGYAKPGPNVPRRGRFWVPLLSLWTGMRLGECCQLHVEDVTEYEGVPVILINDNAEPGGDEADKKRVKTKAGRRFVPVHPELERIGFLMFVAEKRKAGERRLFPEIKPDSTGYLSGTFSKFFNDKRRFLGKLGMAGTGVSFHSFRHNYRDALREAEISLERVRALGGWKRDSEGEEARYGSGLKAATLYQEIAKVRYPGLDLTHL